MSKPTPAAAAANRSGRPHTGDGRSAQAFAAVWLPSLVVIIATGGCLFTVSWWVSQGPGGGAGLGVVVGFSSLASLITLTVVSGVLDRADRRTALLRLLLIIILPVVALAVVFRYSAGSSGVLLAGICYLLITTAEALYLATTETISVDLAPGHWPSARTALLTQIHSQVERMIAPTLAGVLIAAGAVEAVPLAAAALIACVLVGVFAARRTLHFGTPGNSAAPAESSDLPRGALRRLLRDAKSAVHLVRQHQDLVFLVQLGILGNVIVFPFYAVLPAFISDYASSPADVALWYGRAATAYGIGMLGGTLVMVRLRRDLSGYGAIFGASCCLGAICLVLTSITLTPWPGAVTVAMTVNGALFAVMVAVGGAVWINRTPADIRVRVFALRRLTVFSSIPLGTMLMGFGGAALGYRSFVRILALVVLVALIAAWLRHRAVVRRSATT